MKTYIIDFLILFLLNTIFQSLMSYFLEGKIELNSIIIESLFFAIVMTYFMNWLRKREAKNEEN